MLLESDTSGNQNVKKLISFTAFLIIYPLLLHFAKIFLEINKLYTSAIVQGLKRMRKIIRASRRERFIESNPHPHPILCSNRTSILGLWHRSIFFRIRLFLQSPISRSVFQCRSQSVGYRVCSL